MIFELNKNTIQYMANVTTLIPNIAHTYNQKGVIHIKAIL